MEWFGLLDTIGEEEEREGGGKKGLVLARLLHWQCQQKHHEHAYHTKERDLRLDYQSLCSIQGVYLLSYMY